MEKKTTTGRLIAKTSALTFLALTLVLIIGVSFFMLAFTYEAAGTFNNLGWRGLSARLSYASYQKDRDINKLAEAADRAISAGGNELIFKYTGELIEHEYYADYVEYINELYQTNPDVGSSNYDYYIKGYYYAAMYRRSKNDGEKLSVVGLVRGEMAGIAGYPVNNPISYVAKACAEDSNAGADVTELLLDWYEAAFNGISDTARKKNLCLDAYIVAAAHGANPQIWQDRYQSLS